MGEARNQPPQSDDGGDRFDEAYQALLSLARAHFRLQPASHTLQPTALVHEVYLRLAGAESGPPADGEHLLALASRAMRQVLVDHARKKNAIKRGGAAGDRLTLSDVGTGDGEWDVLALNDAIEQLAKLEPRQAQIVEMRFFGGLTVEQTAQALGVTERTVYLDWQMAKSWLWAELRMDDE